MRIGIWLGLAAWLVFGAGYFTGIASEARRVAHGTCAEFLQ